MKLANAIIILKHPLGKNCFNHEQSEKQTAIIVQSRSGTEVTASSQTLSKHGTIFSDCDYFFLGGDNK